MKNRSIGILVILFMIISIVYTGTIPIIAEEINEQKDSLVLENAPNHIRELIEKNISEGAILLNDNYDDLYSLTLGNPDGTKTRFAFSEPIKFKDSDNKIKFKNDKLVKVKKLFSSYAYENGNNTFNVYFPKKIKDGILLETGNYSINFRPLTNKNIKAERKIAIFHSSTEEIVEYPNVFGEGTALQYKALINGIKENIILNEYKGQNIFQFYIDLDHLVPATLEAESIPLLDPETKEVVAILGQPDARDSYTGEYKEGVCHYTLSNHLKLTKEKKNWVLSIVIDKNFLENDTTVYPVVIDPIVAKYEGDASIEDTTIYSTSNENYSAYLNLVAGYTDARYGEGRILVKYKDINKFENIIPENIIDAKFHIYESSDYTNKIMLRLYEVEQLWDQMTVNWNNCPRVGNFVCDKLISSSKRYYTFPIRGLFQSWLRTYRSTNINNGYSFLMRGFLPNGGETCERRNFLSSHWMVQQKPYFEITYTENNSLADGVYFIKNKQSGMYLDIENKSISSGANVFQWEFSGELSQQWRVKKEGSFYTIHPVVAPNCSLRANGIINESNITIYGENYTGDDVLWSITYNDYADSTYRLILKNGLGRTMVVQNASSTNGANVFLYDYSVGGNRNDDWIFERAEILLNTPLILQPNDYSWCWAASAEMVAKTYNINYNRTQEDAVIYIKGSSIDDGGTMNETERAAEYISNNQLDFYSSQNDIYSENMLTKIIMNGNPVIIKNDSYDSGGNIIENTGHVQVVYGYYYGLSDGIRYFYTKDPNGIDTFYSYNELVRFGEKRWSGIVTRNVNGANSTIPRPIT